MLEVYRPIAGFPRYRVSYQGTVQRDDGLVMTPSRPRNRREYPCVHLRANGKRHRIAVHRLVALAWLGPPPFAYAQVRHLDGNHQNPCANNLAWGTGEENAADRAAHGQTATGERHGMARLTNEQRQQVGQSDEPTSALAARFGVHRTTIQKTRAALRASKDQTQ